MRHTSARIMAALCAVCFCTAGAGCRFPAGVLSYDDMKALTVQDALPENTFIIDIRPADEWADGSIQHAINIPADELLSPDGSLLEEGEALVSIVTEKYSRLVIYGRGEEDAQRFARAAVFLGYRRTAVYGGGIEDWRENNDYLVVAYESMKAWYDLNCPFTDDERYLVDVMNAQFYADNHIPGAINIAEYLFVADNELVNEGAVLLDTITNTEAEVMFYCFSSL